MSSVAETIAGLAAAALMATGLGESPQAASASPSLNMDWSVCIALDDDNRAFYHSRLVQGVARSEQVSRANAFLNFAKGRGLDTEDPIVECRFDANSARLTRYLADLEAQCDDCAPYRKIDTGWPRDETPIDPSEARATAALNAEVLARDNVIVAENAERQRRFEDQVAARRVQHERAQAEHRRLTAAQRALNERRMAEWRARVAACEAGNVVSCAPR